MVRHSYPPQFVVANKPISAEEAQQAIATYLQESELEPRMHPDALLSTSGVQFASAGGPQGGIVLHNLRRVDAGLQGEVLKPDVPEDFTMMDIDPVADTTVGAQQPEGQDRDEWEREQDIVEDQGVSTTFVADGTEVPEVAVEGSSKLDKEARKKAKKERERQLKREKEQKKRQEADA
ncbi:uncharacterized protein J3D65DRAFT_97102 [Phyllosticta citribraziliensis]|uniref:Uncharacterized protein n=1 Tax=Phyllosticta citribraziliensis TaxID=989973 RepID=A0ABR1LAE1_9PEZI